MRKIIKKSLIAAAIAALLSATLIAQEKSGAQIPSSRRDRWQKPVDVINSMNLKPGQVVVDIGAGDGYFTRRFAVAVAPEGKAIGVDISSRSIRSLMADAKRLGLDNYEARLVPPDDPMLAPQSVDVIFLCDTYHEMEGRVEYFRRVRKALKPGGRLFVIDSVKTRRRDSHAIEKEVVTEELRQAGYSVVKEFDFLLPRQFFVEFEPATAKQ